ncbi:MAG: hypothetical protein H0T62_12480 [Parachlamydiaceae bacterium]|nr:hypothetical protein [Parachlamydiaceae bacterium]
MNKSRGITVIYPRKNETYDQFKSRYIRFEDISGSTFYDYDGFRHVGSARVLAPSEEVWNDFVKEKLVNVKIAPLETYLFNHDPAQIKNLLDEYKISAVHSRSFVDSSTEGREIVDFFGKPHHGYRIDSLSLYTNRKNIGEVSVQENTFKIIETIADPKIKHVVEFIENVMFV